MDGLGGSLLHSLEVFALQHLFVFNMPEVDDDVVYQFYGTCLLLSESGIKYDHLQVEVYIINLRPRRDEGFVNHGP